MDCSMPGFCVPHHLLKFAPIHVRCISDAIQPTRATVDEMVGWLTKPTNQVHQDLALICRSDSRSMFLSSCLDKWLPKACSFHSNSHEYLSPSLYLHHICLICHWSQWETGTHTLLSMRPRQAKDQPSITSVGSILLHGGPMEGADICWQIICYRSQSVSQANLMHPKATGSSCRSVLPFWCWWWTIAGMKFTCLFEPFIFILTFKIFMSRFNGMASKENCTVSLITETLWPDFIEKNLYSLRINLGHLEAVDIIKMQEYRMK